MNKTLVAMSGGVDSSVAALLLKNAGEDCVGVNMKLYCGEDATSCSNADGSADAKKVADLLGIPFSVVDYQKEFDQSVISYFIDTYLSGGTPNPCVECNRVMKFGKLFEVADKLGCSHIATGHYARIENQNGRFLLRRSLNDQKDQSYVLWSLTQDQLSRVRFPLGELSKEEVREIALANGLCNADRKDSQDICFVPDGDYVSFIQRHRKLDFPDGDFLDLSGNVIGRHHGSIHYTVGQRKGLGMGFGHPVYVVRKDPSANTVTLGENNDLFSDTLTAHQINLIPVSHLDKATKLLVKVRYLAPPVPATVEQTDSDTLVIHFDSPVRAVTKGQSVVLYSSDYLFGGGVIE